MATITLTLPTSGTIVTAGLHSTNYSAIQAAVNGGLDNNNFAAGKIFDNTKIMQGGAVLNQVMQWNGTSWVPGQKITTSTWAGGPPGSPSDGDIWIATAVDAAGTRWHFQYNAGSASAYKWEFIGGAPASLTAGSVGVVLTAATQVGATGFWYNPAGMSYTPSRAGDWRLDGQTSVDPNAGAAGDVTANTFTGAALGALGTVVTAPSTTAKTAIPVAFDYLAVNASQIFGVALATPANGTYKIFVQTLRVCPRRIA